MHRFNIIGLGLGSRVTTFWEIATPLGNSYCLIYHMSPVMRKPDFCICENKDADQLRGNREADQRLCFRYTDSTIPLLPKSEISSLLAFSVTVQPGLCRTWSETPKTGFLRTRLIYSLFILFICCFSYYVWFQGQDFGSDCVSSWFLLSF